MQQSTLPLSHGLTLIFDEEDRAFVESHTWCVAFSGDNNTPYIKTRVGKRLYRFHRLLLGAPGDRLVDHINGNTLDNRRSNLRLCSYAENSRNRRKTKPTSSKFKGVVRVERANRWVAKIKVNRATKYIGCFVDETDAARAYDAAAIKFHGTFAKLNFPSLTQERE